MPTLPRPSVYQLPVGDSRVLRMPPPRDRFDGTLVDPGSYQEIRVVFPPSTEFEPYLPTGPAALVKTLSGGGVTLDNDTDEVVVSLTPDDTRDLGVGRFLIHIRLERGTSTAHSVVPFHVLEVTPAGI